MKNTCLDNIHFKSEFIPVDAYYGMDCVEWDENNRHFSFGNFTVTVMHFPNYPQKWKVTLIHMNHPTAGRWAWPELHIGEWNWLCLAFSLPTDRAVLRFLRMMERHVQDSSVRFNNVQSEFEYLVAKVTRQCKQMGGIIESIERR